LGDDWGLAYALYMLGLVAVIQRDYNRALARHEESLALARKSGNDVGILQALGLGALAALVQGVHRQVDTIAKTTMDLSRRLGIGHYTISCLSILGASATLQGRWIRAVRLWSAEASLREAMGIPRMPAELSFYEPYVQTARAHLDEVTWEAAWSAGSAMDMEQAIEYALSEGEFTPPPEEPPAGAPQVPLTRREQEVASLVARGLTNRQIATEIFISEHTVANHVAKILRKLGLSSRSQMTAWVVEQRTLP
jgi:non-specific serine/threonine protein kinase